MAHIEPGRLCLARFSPGGLCALATVLIWSGSFLAIRDGVGHASSLELAGARFSIVGAFAMMWLIFAPGIKPNASDLARIAACGFLGIAAYNAFLGWGEERVGAAAAAFVVAGQTIVARGLDSTERPATSRRGLWVSFGLFVAGMATIASGLADNGLWGGLGLCFLAAACSGAYLVLQRPLIRKRGPVTSAAATMAFGLLLLSPWVPDGIGKIVTNPKLLWPVLYLSLAAGVVAYCFWMKAIDALGPTAASRWLIVMAPLAAAFDWIGDPGNFRVSLLLGGCLCVLACVPTYRLQFVQMGRPHWRRSGQ